MSSPNPWDYADKSGAEHAHQAALFMWANMAEKFGIVVANDKRAYTEAGWAMANAGEPIWQFKWFHAIKNQEKGGVIRGTHAKAEGVKAMFLPMPKSSVDFLHGNSPMDFRLDACGLYIELKVGKNQPDNKQLEFQANMRLLGYRCEIVWGWLDARRVLCEYLGLSLEG